MRISNQTKDLLISLAIAISALLLASYYDANEEFIEWAEQYEGYEIDELPVAAAALSLCFAWFAWRRWREQKHHQKKLTFQLQAIERLQQQQAQSEQKAIARSTELSIVGTMAEQLLAATSVEQALSSFQHHFSDLTKQRASALMLNNSEHDEPIIREWNNQARERIFDLQVDLQEAECNKIMACACSTNLTTDPKRQLCLPIRTVDNYHGLICLALNEPDDAERLSDLVAPAINILALTLSNLSLRDNLLHQSIKDPLTGLLNRRGWQEKTKLFSYENVESEHKLSVITLDIDFFKNINDNLGHDAGDLALKTLSGVIEEHTRKEDLCCRLGGDEVALLLPGVDLEQAVLKANLINQGFKQKAAALLNSASVQLSLSAGVSSFPDDGSNIKSLLDKSDKYLYQAKKAGRNQVQSALS